MTYRNDDLDLDLSSPSAGRPPGPADGGHSTGSRLVVVVVAVAIACAALLAWFWWSSRQPTAEVVVPSEASSEAPVTPEASRLGDGPPADLPPLEELDPTVRGMMAALSARPELASLLATDDLVRRFVVGVDRVSRGASPSGQVSVLKPPTQFSVDRPNEEGRILPESFTRYGGTVAMVQSLDPETLAQIYGQLRPRLNEAYAELGVPGETFDAAVERAIVHLLSVSPSRAEGAVAPVKGTTYGWVDPETENLSQAQKQLLRLGPAQAAAVQEHLRRVAVALGIPAERLPPAR